MALLDWLHGQLDVNEQVALR